MITIEISTANFLCDRGGIELVDIKGDHYLIFDGCMMRIGKKKNH